MIDYTGLTVIIKIINTRYRGILPVENLITGVVELQYDNAIRVLGNWYHVNQIERV